MNSRRAWFVYIGAALAYFSSVLQRSSLGVAGLEAQDRFLVTAAVLSTLAVVQVIVYALLQVPVGILIDRVGPRVLLIVGAALMTAGQLLLALTPEFSLALVARLLVGMGDAATFNSALRIVVSWFTPRIATALTQLTGTMGQLGQLLSALPFALLLGWQGWTVSFLSAASVAALALLLVVVFVADGPADSPRPQASQLSLVMRRLRIALARPGTWLGFWIHYVTLPGGSVIGLLWGMPFFQEALGYSHAVSASLLMVPIFTAVVTGPLAGIVMSRFPRARVGMVLAVLAANTASWVILAVWPGVPPLWFIVLHMALIGLCGPASMVAFDVSRTVNPNNSLGVANGVVNVGGFTSSFLALLCVGVVLDVMDSLRIAAGATSELYSLDSFRVAFLGMQVVPAVGAVMLFICLHLTRNRARRHHVYRMRNSDTVLSVGTSKE